MRNVIFRGLVAAALGTAVLGASIVAASAQVARPQPALAIGDGNNQSELLTLVRGGGGGGHGGGGGGGMRMGGGGGGFAMRGGGGGDFAMRDRSARSFAMARASNQGRFVGNNMRRRFDHDHDGDHNHHFRCFNGRCFPFFALGVGVGAYAADYPYYYDNSYYAAGNDAVAYCASRYQSYDPASGTYLGYDGLRHPCP